MNTSKIIRRWIIGLVIAALILSLALALAAQLQRAQAAEHTLAETTLAALTSAAEEVQALALAMDKLALASPDGQGATLLYDAVIHADRARLSLTALPADALQLSPVLAYLSRLHEQAGSLLTEMAAGRAVASGAIADLAAAQSDLTLLHAEMMLAREALLDGASLSDALPPSAITAAPTAAELAAYRALPAEEVSSGTAMQIAREFVGIDRVTSVSPAPDTSGALPAYGITVQTGDMQLNLEITRRGGKVLLMSPETAGFTTVKSIGECQQAAIDFLTSRGFASMEAAYYQVYDGLCVLTCVHVQEGALIWPDRVMVQVRMDTAEVVGLEARSYWRHHIPRKIGTPLLTADEARAALSPAAQEQAVLQAVLPVGGQERLCWQFTVLHNDDTYLSFIDATTGRELLLEKVMQLDVGSVPA